MIAPVPKTMSSVVGLRGAADELVADHDGVADRRDRERATTQSLAARPLGAAEDDEGQQQRDRQERGPVDLRGERPEDPEDREQREPGAEHRDELRREAVEVAAGALGLELVEEVIGRLGRVACRAFGHVPSTAIRRCTRVPAVERDALAADHERAAAALGRGQGHRREARRVGRHEPAVA